MGDFEMASSILSTEAQFTHALFLQQIERMSFEQRGELLAQLHLLQLTQHQFIKDTLRP